MTLQAAEAKCGGCGHLDSLHHPAGCLGTQLINSAGCSCPGFTEQSVPAEDPQRYAGGAGMHIQLGIAGQPMPWGLTYGPEELARLHGAPARLHVTPDRRELWLLVGDNTKED